MYRIETDVHTHTLISLHAYSTAEECARHAAQAGLRGVAGAFLGGAVGVQADECMRVNVCLDAVHDPAISFPFCSGSFFLFYLTSIVRGLQSSVRRGAPES